MQRWVLVASILVMGSIAAAQDKTPDSMATPVPTLERSVINEHPHGYFILAMREFERGNKDEAVRWLYVGQIRWRFHLAANPNLPPDGDPALLASLMETVGRPINEWAGGDVDAWVSAMQAALDWDHDNPNGFTDKLQHATEYENVRSGLTDLITSVSQQREEIPEERALKGLENRVR